MIYYQAQVGQSEVSESNISTVSLPLFHMEPFSASAEALGGRETCTLASKMCALERGVLLRQYTASNHLSVSKAVDAEVAVPVQRYGGSSNVQRNENKHIESY